MSLEGHVILKDPTKLKIKNLVVNSLAILEILM